jgi:hypothetical protein
MDFIAQAFNHIEPADLSLEDIMLWNDDDWCYRYEMVEPSNQQRGADYRVIPFGSEGYLDIVGAQ